MSTQHTPTPWIADNVNAPDDAPTAIWMNDGTDTYYHRTSQVAECFFDSSEDALDQTQGRRVEKTEAVANAAFIVKACNSHEQLVAALKEYDEAFTEFNADSKASRHRMRMATIGARAALVSK